MFDEFATEGEVEYSVAVIITATTLTEANHVLSSRDGLEILQLTETGRNIVRVSTFVARRFQHLDKRFHLTSLLQQAEIRQVVRVYKGVSQT